MSFSVPRCRSPICGSTRSTTSPSSSSTRRSTPCAAGCCGPKLIVKLRVAPSRCPPTGMVLTVSAMLLSSRRHLQLRRLFGFGGDARVEFVPGDHEAFVTTFADKIDAVVRLDIEGDAVADDLGQFDIDRHRHPRQRGCEVTDIDMDAEAA